MSQQDRFLQFNSLSDDLESELSATVYFPYCNLECKYCYNLKNLQANILGGRALSVNEVKGKINKLIVNGVRRVDWIVFSGGECTSNLSVLKELILFAKKLGFKVCVFTNGLTPHIMKHFELVDFISLDLKLWETSDSNLISKFLTTEGYLQYIRDFIEAASKASKLLDIRTVICKKSTGLDHVKYFETLKNLLKDTTNLKTVHLSNAIINDDNLCESFNKDESVSKQELEDFTKNLKDLAESQGFAINFKHHFLESF